MKKKNIIPNYVKYKIKNFFELLYDVLTEVYKLGLPKSYQYSLSYTTIKLIWSLPKDVLFTNCGNAEKQNYYSLYHIDLSKLHVRKKYKDFLKILEKRKYFYYIYTIVTKILFKTWVNAAFKVTTIH